MRTEYDIDFLYKYGQSDGGVWLRVFSEGPDVLAVAKTPLYEVASRNEQLVQVKSGLKLQHEADRAFFHYILDCWLDGKPLALTASDLP